jgi:hypothetical protein
MNRENKKNWLKESIEKSKEELFKLSKIGRLRFELVNLNRNKNRKFRNLGKKVYLLIEEGSIDKEPFEPEYLDLVDIFDNIDKIKHSIEDLKKHQEIEVLKAITEKNEKESEVSGKLEDMCNSEKNNLTENINEKSENK